MLHSAMLYYDYALTFTREIEHFWRGARPSLASALFVLNRYFGLLGPIPVIFEYFVTLSSSVSFSVVRTLTDPELKFVPARGVAYLVEHVVNALESQ